MPYLCPKFHTSDSSGSLFHSIIIKTTKYLFRTRVSLLVYGIKYFNESMFIEEYLKRLISVPYIKSS
jgi:hypothetical protein